ncbi:hypothetical protein [Roseibacillus persicicus]|uniref:Uncharacterized protein n=1 Tax=Roseibacillus persicicus TaxID=454148 RepID=A0A918TN32_9BACT|nr:hypothetical protein [Roseibacillus persicicus]GHC52351.1 hypothetical protein GCM10007100_18330 [Roseibacillus persicicus]
MSPTSDSDPPEDVGEISPEDLARLNQILAQGPGADASDEEIDKLIEQVRAIPGGAAMWDSLQQQLAAGEGPLLDEVNAHRSADLEKASDLPDLGLYRTPESIFHLVYTIHPQSKEIAWRRISLPLDACFYDLHYAVQDVFEQVNPSPHWFEYRVGDQVEMVIGQSGGEDDYCEFQNRPADFFDEGAKEIFYRQEGAGAGGYRIVFEKVIEPTGIKLSERSLPQFIEGQDLSSGSSIQFRIPTEKISATGAD